VGGGGGDAATVSETTRYTRPALLWKLTAQLGGGGWGVIQQHPSFLVLVMVGFSRKQFLRHQFQSVTVTKMSNMAQSESST
jgi:hypothetical protein